MSVFFDYLVVTSTRKHKNPVSDWVLNITTVLQIDLNKDLTTQVKGVKQKEPHKWTIT